MATRPDTAKAQIKLRLREPLRAKLEEEAKKGGLSLNAEIARRLENSLLDEQIGSLVFRDKDLFALANIFTTFVRVYEIQRNKTWSYDFDIPKLACDTLCELLAKAPEAFETGAWPSAFRTISDHAAFAAFNELMKGVENVRASDA